MGVLSILPRTIGYPGISAQVGDTRLWREGGWELHRFRRFQ